jgi:hypothetical protein
MCNMTFNLSKYRNKNFVKKLLYELKWGRILLFVAKQNYSHATINYFTFLGAINLIESKGFIYFAINLKSDFIFHVSFFRRMKS